MDITPRNEDEKVKSIRKLLIRTVFICIAIVILFVVIAKTGEALWPFAVYSIKNVYVDIEDADNTVTLSSDYYASGVYNLNKTYHSKYIELDLSEEVVYKVAFINKHNKCTDNYIIISTINTDYDKYLYLIPQRIRKNGFQKIEITPVKSGKKYTISGLNLHDTISKDDFNDYEIVDYTMKNVDIKVSKDNLEEIAQYRANAMDRGLILSSERVGVPANITVEGKTMPISMRLKGDWTDHLGSSKWSFRIDLDEGNAYGLKSFSLHSPFARHGLNEYIIHKVAKKYDAMGLKYYFSHVTINGEYWGVYAIEQSFDNMISHYTARPNGVFVKSEKYNNYEKWAYGNNCKLTSMDYCNFTTFNKNEISGDEALYEYGQYAVEMIDSLIRGELDVDQVFDIDSYAKHIAIADLSQSVHGTAVHNQRYYFNPYTAKLAPITYDMSGYGYYFSDKHYVINNLLLSNKEFTTLYMNYLKEMINEYDKTLEENSTDIIRAKYMLKLDNDDEGYDYDYIKAHHNTMLERIDKDNTSFVLSDKDDNSCYLTISCPGPLRVLTEGLFYDGEPLDINLDVTFYDVFLDMINHNKIAIDKKLLPDDLDKLTIRYITLYDYTVKEKKVIYEK